MNILNNIRTYKRNHVFVVLCYFSSCNTDNKKCDPLPPNVSKILRMMEYKTVQRVFIIPVNYILKRDKIVLYWLKVYPYLCLRNQLLQHPVWCQGNDTHTNYCTVLRCGFHWIIHRLYEATTVSGSGSWSSRCSIVLFAQTHFRPERDRYLILFWYYKFLTNICSQVCRMKLAVNHI